MDYYRGTHSPWNMMPAHQAKETNALTMNKKIMSILADTENAIRERNAAIAETKEALQARDEALKQRDEALVERDKALMERDNAREALQYLENAMSFPLSGGNHRGMKRLHHPVYHQVEIAQALNNPREAHITDAFPLSSITADAVTSCQVKRTKENKSSKGLKTPRKGKKMGEDLNVQAYSDGIKFKSEWDIQDVGLNLIAFDDSIMPVPVCSCTGVPRPCYKWGNGGWQSSCCTTTMSMYPLPQMPNKRHARVSGRKMSGSVFTRLLTRMAKAGHDLSVPVDLKDYWARHGTNRYITIK